MRKMVLILAMAVLTLAGCGKVQDPSGELYGRFSVVYEINGDEVVCKDMAGNLWVFCGAEDWQVNDACVLTMRKNGTPTIFDDEIVAATYNRWGEISCMR